MIFFALLGAGVVAAVIVAGAMSLFLRRSTGAGHGPEAPGPEPRGTAEAV